MADESYLEPLTNIRRLAKDTGLTDASGNAIKADYLWLAGVAPGAGGTLSPKGNALVSVTTASQTITQLLVTAAGSFIAIPAGSLVCRIQPRGGDIRFTDDGQVPTIGASGLGKDIYDKVDWPVEGAVTIAAVRLIAISSTSCMLDFYG